MAKQVAFLRAINVGGHTVKMDVLRQIFQELGLTHVETFIASGNVIFDATDEAVGVLQDRIEKQLKTSLGYDVATFIRSQGEIQRITGFQAFDPGAVAQAVAYNVGFMRDPLDGEAKQKLFGLRTAIDDFATNDREIYWLCKQRQSDSTFSNQALEKTLKIKSTLRNMSTVRNIMTKYSF